MIYFLRAQCTVYSSLLDGYKILIRTIDAIGLCDSVRLSELIS